MKFGSVPLAGALGAVLAHSVQTRAGRLRKGKVLDAQDIEALRLVGETDVTVARMDVDDVIEDLAAHQLAQALAPDPVDAGLSVSRATTGRVNLFAAVSGIAEIDAAKIDAINAIDPMITIATVPKWQRMDAKGMVATVKIISYAVPKPALDKACGAAKGALRVRSAQRRQADLIQTVIGDEGGEKGHRVIAQRLNRLGAELGDKILVPHRVEDISKALRSSQAEVLLILTGSATSDIQDTAPEALRRAGGQVHHFGMPVDPGNLLFIGALDGRPVIGLPGCARSPALNGADWVMERIICGIPVTGQDISGMGVGGLLKEIPTRPRPREA